MKIGIDASRYVSETATGVEWYSHHIIDGLIREILNHDNTEAVLYSPTPFKIPKEYEDMNRVRKRIIPMRRFWTLWKLSREMKKNPPDVLFVPSHTLPLYRPAFSVITIHDVAFRYLKGSYSKIQYWYLNWSTKYAVKHASKIIVPSRATRDDLIKKFKCGPDKIIVIPHGFKKNRHLDENKISENLKYFEFDGKRHPYVFFVGRLESKKNLVRLVDAFEKFSKNHPDWRLVLAGKRGVGFERLLDTVKELKLTDKVFMPGYVDDQEKAYLFKYCNIFAFPSLYEGFGFPILEAFAYEKPVLTSHVSSMPEVGQDACHYCDPYDTSSIVQGLEKIAEDPEFREHLVEKSQKVLEGFKWETAVKRTFDVLTK